MRAHYSHSGPLLVPEHDDHGRLVKTTAVGFADFDNNGNVMNYRKYKTPVEVDRHGGSLHRRV